MWLSLPRELHLCSRSALSGCGIVPPSSKFISPLVYLSLVCSVTRASSFCASLYILRTDFLYSAITNTHTHTCGFGAKQSGATAAQATEGSGSGNRNRRGHDAPSLFAHIAAAWPFNGLSLFGSADNESSNAAYG